jgi:hypothetical protein
MQGDLSQSESAIPREQLVTVKAHEEKNRHVATSATH